MGKYREQESNMTIGKIAIGGEYFPYHGIIVLPKRRAKSLTQWISIMHLSALVDVMLQSKYKTRKSKGQPLLILKQKKLPGTVVHKAVAMIALSMV